MSKVYKKKDVDENVYDLAIKRINRTFDIFDTVAVMFSGGKDSTVCLNLTLQIARERKKLPLDVFFFDEEAIPYETIDYVKRVADLKDVRMHWLCLPVKHRNGCSLKEPYWYPWAPEDKAKWVRPMPSYSWVKTQDDFNFFPKEKDKRPSVPECNGMLFPPEDWGEVGVVMGIRSEESLTRYRTILQTGSGRRYEDYIINLKSKTALGNVFKVCPIYDMRTVDVWTAPHKFNWDYNTTYDLLEKLGLTALQARCAPPFGEEPMRGLWQYSIAFPDIWDRMQNRVTGSATAARYANTELYAFNGLPQKPEDMTWLEFIDYHIMKHKEEFRPMIKKSVNDFIKQHYRKTKEPLMKTHHYETGIGYDFLLRIAMRGDFKSRKAPLFSADKKITADQKVRYNKERYG
tara:strand:+ start:1031 stop:2239 length:1209 start_codon:yes stop_codon:yes gene_type:complete